MLSTVWSEFPKSYLVPPRNEPNMPMDFKDHNANNTQIGVFLAYSILNVHNFFPTSIKWPKLRNLDNAIRKPPQMVDAKVSRTNYHGSFSGLLENQPLAQALTRPTRLDKRNIHVPYMCCPWTSTYG